MKPIINVDDLTHILKEHYRIEKLTGVTTNTVQKITKHNLYIPLPLAHSHIEVKTSNIHGKGVFATDNIPAGSIITFYPAHSVCIDGLFYFFKDYDNDSFKENIENNNYCKIYGFSGGFSTYTNGDNITIIGNPDNTENTLLLGHMINDAAGNVFENIRYEETDGIKFKNAVATYYVNGKNKKNCKISVQPDSLICYVVATRNIVAGEELLVLYDSIYWYDINYNKNAYSDNEAIDKFKKIFKDETFMRWFINVYSE